MCDPTGGIATIALLAAAAGTSAYSQVQQGKYQNEIAQNNAKIAGIQAHNELRSGAAEDQQQRWKIRAIMAKQAAGFGAGNVVGSTGTPLDILGETAMFGEVDLNTIRNNAARRAWGYDVDRSNSLAEGKLAKYGARMGAAGTLLGAGAQAAGIFGSLPGSTSSVPKSLAKQAKYNYSSALNTINTGSSLAGYT